MNKWLSTTLAAAALVTSINASDIDANNLTPVTNDTKASLDFILKEGGNVGIGWRIGNTYILGQSNFKDTSGWAAAYNFDAGVTFGWGYSQKDNIGSQSTLGLAYTTWFEGGYVSASVIGKQFNADTGYADSKSFKGKLKIGYELVDDLYLSAAAGYRTFDADKYEKENGVIWEAAFNYYADNFSIGVRGIRDCSISCNNSVIWILNIPFYSDNSKPSSSFEIGQEEIARDITTNAAYFDDSMVKVEKVENINNAPTLNLNVTWDGWNLRWNVYSIPWVDYTQHSSAWVILDSSWSTDDWSIVNYKVVSSVNGTLYDWANSSYTSAGTWLYDTIETLTIEITDNLWLKTTKAIKVFWE